MWRNCLCSGSKQLILIRLGIYQDLHSANAVSVFTASPRGVKLKLTLTVWLDTVTVSAIGLRLKNIHDTNASSLPQILYKLLKKDTLIKIKKKFKCFEYYNWSKKIKQFLIIYFIHFNVKLKLKT